MKYREALLLPAEDVGEAGVKTIDIDIDKPISRIEITFKTTKASQGMSAGAPANIPKIQLVDGSKPLHSLSGYESQALAYYSRPGRVLDHGQHISTLSEVDIYPIDFGRWLWDPLLAFDPKRFSNPQLKIQYDEDVSDTSVTENALEVWAHIFDEKDVSPMGFLSAVEHHAYTCGSENSYEHVMLPEDRPIRQMLVRAYRDGYEPWTTIDEARLDEGSLDRIPWEYNDLEMFYRRMKAVWPMIVQQFSFIADTGALTFYVAPTDYYSGFLGAGLAATTELFHSGASSKGGKLGIDASANTNALGLVFGWLPWHCYQFPMGQKDDPDDWYDPAGKKPRLRLRAGSNGTNGTGNVILEQLWKY
ncbi:MAG: hypothetical protein M0R06_06475 [Sphaerochaeta sp.]|jgi:hypothetical protein|nr:hypothetical protein [Sphaerochaeta sp.]MDD4985142.1 hypothetical protein [Dehalococcoidales bacterium]